MANAQLPCWIWSDYPGGDLINAWVQCRHAFTLAARPAEAWVNVTADQRYRLFVNGSRVQDGPVRGMPDEWFYDRVDLAPYLKPGANVIAALVHNPGLGHHSYIHSGFAGFLLWGFAGEQKLDTNTHWKARRAPDYLRYQTRMSIQLGWQEFFDARLTDGEWTELGYDDSSWKTVNSWNARPKGCAPWHHLQERDIPDQRRFILEPHKICATGRGGAGVEWEASRNVTLLAAREQKFLQSTQLPGSAAVQVGAQSSTEVQLWVLDFDREVLGTTLLEITGAAGGEFIDVNFTEGCANGQPALKPQEGCGMAPGHRYICRAGDQAHELLSPLGGRYLVVSVHGATPGFSFKVTMRQREYPFRPVGTLQTVGSRFGEIYDLCTHTQQLCASDTYIDCPSREQAMWWGDIVTHYGNSQRMDCDDRLMVRGLRLLGRHRLPNGLTYSHAPTKAHECVLPDFTLAWIRSHWLHYWGTGRTDLISEHRYKINDAFGYFEEQSRETGLLSHDPRYWLFLDWAETFKDGVPTLYNLEYLETLEDAARMFALIGAKDDAAKYAARAEALRQTIGQRLWDSTANLPYDGITWEGEPVPRRSLHCIVHCILTGIGAEHHARWAEKLLLPFVNGPRPKGVPLYRDVGADIVKTALTPYFMHFALLALTKLGRDEAALDCIERWWGDMLDRGLRTTEECWDAEAGTASLCHAWSAHPLQHISNLLLGIHQSAPGWRKIIYRPVFRGDSAQGVVDTPQGPIRSEWKRNGTTISCHLELPRGVEAQIEVGGEIQQVTGPFAGDFSA